MFSLSLSSKFICFHHGLFCFRVFLINLPMQAKLVMASLKGEQLRTTLELLMPTLGMGAFFYCYKAIPLEGPLYLVAGLGGERNTCCQVWLCGAGEAGGQGCLSIMQMGMASGLSSSLTSSSYLAFPSHLP